MSKSNDGAFVINFSEPRADGQWGVATAYKSAGPAEDFYNQRAHILQAIEFAIGKNLLLPVCTANAAGKLEWIRIPAGTITRVGLTEESIEWPK